METRSKGPLAGFGWLSQGLTLWTRHPNPLLGGAALLVVICMLPSLFTLPLQFHALKTGTPLNSSGFGVIMMGSMLAGLLIVPLYAGYLQMIAAVERGQAARARDIFNPYREGGALRLIGFALIVMVAYIAVFGIIVMSTGGDFAHWYVQVLTARANHQPPPTTLPQGFGTTLALGALFGIFMMGFYSISLGQIVLRGRSVLEALGDGIVGALKNLLPLLVFAISLVVACVVLAIALLIVGLLAALLGALLGHWLAMAVMFAVYLAMMLMIFVVMFGTMYCLWRDVCGDDVAPGTTPPLVA